MAPSGLSFPGKLCPVPLRVMLLRVMQHPTGRDFVGAAVLSANGCGRSRDLKAQRWLPLRHWGPGQLRMARPRDSGLRSELSLAAFASTALFMMLQELNVLTHSGFLVLGQLL